MGMDFYGQKLAEDLGHGIIMASFAIGTVIGFWKQSLLVALYAWIAGFILAILLCVPPWPWYCSHPIKWQSKKISEVEKSD